MPTPVIGFCQSEVTLYGAGSPFPPATDIAPTVAGLVSIGATWVRVLADWKSLEPSPGSYSWSLMDAALIALTNAGINVLVVPADTVNWTPSPMAFATFCTTMAQRYGPGGVVTLAIPVRYWEIWNEPNSFFSAPPAQSGIPGMYAYQKAGYDAIHAVDSGAFVLSAGLLPAPNGWFTTDAVTWLTGMYAAAPKGGPYPWDGVAFHPYSSTDNAGAQEPTATQVWIAEIPQLYQVMVANSDGAKPIWLTEFGFETQPSGVGGGILVTPAIQAQWLIQQINVMQTVADQAGITLGPMFPYNYRNSLPDNSGSDGMGVVNFDFSKKPAWSAVQTYISGGAPVGVTSGGTIIKPGRPTITMAGTGPTGVTVGGTIIKPGRPTITMGGSTVTGIAAANWAALGISLNPVSVPMNSFQSLTDELVGEVGSTITDLTNVLSGIGAAAESAGQAANGAVGDLLSLITGIVGGEAAAIAALVAALNNTASTTVVNANQLAAVWAHLASGTAGIRYSFSPSVALTANYPDTTNPAWSPAGSYTMPSVHAGTAWVYSTSGWQGMVFTGNPNGAATDHGLVTDKNQVFATYRVNAFGSADLFMSGHYVSGNLLQHIVLELGYGGPSALRLYAATAPGVRGLALTMTFPNATTATQYDIPGGVKDGDVWGMQYDGAGTYTLYFNNVAVATVPDPGMTHGAGYRETGILTLNTGGSFFGLAEFTALDYA